MERQKFDSIVSKKRELDFGKELLTEEIGSLRQTPGFAVYIFTLAILVGSLLIQIGFIPSLNIPSRRLIPESKRELAKQRTDRLNERSKKQEENYEVFLNGLIQQQRLELSLKFHDYSSTDISMEQIVNDSHILEDSTVSSSKHEAEGSRTSLQESVLTSSTNSLEAHEMMTPDHNITEKPMFNSEIYTSTQEFKGATETSTAKVNGENVMYVVLQPKKHISKGTQTDYIDLEVENRTLQEEIKLLKDEMKKKVWSVEKIKGNDEMTKFYTGLPTFAVFMWLYNFLQPKAERMTYWGVKKSSLNNKKKKLPLLHQFLAVMMRLKEGIFHQDMADRFEISVTTFSRIFATWIKLMKLELADLFPFPTRALVDKYMPQCFLKYPNTRIIIDCTEIFLERPKSLETQNLTFSNYKSHNTIKFLVGITPGGVSFVSEGWGGRVSDKVITSDSKLILLLDEGDNVMADKGFLIEDLLKEKCRLNIPRFRRTKLLRPDELQN